MKKKLIVKQVDESDCGVCCLLSVIRYYNGNVPLEILKIDTNTSKTGTNAYEIIKAANIYGFEGRGLKVEKVTSLSLPLIAHIEIEEEFYHFVVIYKIDENNIIIMDPAIGKVKMSHDKFYKVFTGYIIELSPVTEITYFKPNLTLVKVIKKFITQNKKAIIKLYIIELILIIVIIFNSFTIKLISTKLAVFTICFTSCVVLKTLLTLKKNNLVTSLKNLLELNLIKNFFSHLLLLPLKFIQLKTSGEILTRFKELSLTSNFIINVLFKNVLEIIICVFTILIIFVLNKQIGLIIILSSLIYILLSYISNKLINPKINKEINNEVEYNSQLTEYINSLETIKILNNYNHFYKKFNLNLKEKITHTINFEKLIGYTEVFKECLSNLTYLIFIFYSFHIGISLIDTITLLNLEMILFDTLRSLLNDLPLIFYEKSTFIKLSEFFSVKEETPKLLIQNEKHNIIFNNVKYTYDKSHSYSYNFKIKENSFIMIKGKNGSGKSTICKLLTGILNDYTGSILVGNKNIKDYSEIDIRNLISYSNQSAKIFKDTIKNNIILNRDVDDKTFSLISNICDLESIVSKKKNRYESIIYENSPNFSGGEIQKIILARTLINNSQIIILDETLSAVNLTTEIKIIKQLKEHFKDRTILYITHKNLDKYFDDVICLN